MMKKNEIEPTLEDFQPVEEILAEDPRQKTIELLARGTDGLRVKSWNVGVSV